MQPNGRAPASPVAADDARTGALEWNDHVGLGHYSDIGLVVCIERHRWPAALGELYRRHGGAALHLATRICGPDQAEEAVAGVLLELWQEPRRFDPDRSSLRSFFMSQTHSRAADMARAIRRASASTAVPHSGPIPHDEPLGPGHVNGERCGDIDEHAGRVLLRLEADEATTLALAYLWGYSLAELAERLDLSERTVARRLRAALISLGAQSSSGDLSRDG